MDDIDNKNDGTGFQVGQAEDNERTEMISPNERITPSDTTKQEKCKRGFRIDDILFSVENKVDKSFKVQSTGCRDTPSPSSPSSLSSGHTSLDDVTQLSPVSPISFSKQPQPEHRRQGGHYKIEHDHHLLETDSQRHHLSSYSSDSSNYPYSEANDCDDDEYGQSSNDPKKPRTSFTPDQIQTLEDSFNEKHYLNHTERTMLADELHLTDCQIKTWFQNRRMKMKRQYKEAVEKGYLIPYHPYPFPRYSRLTPAHFASVPALNSRQILNKNNNNFLHQTPRTNSCTCFAPSNRIYSNNTLSKSIRSMRTSNNYMRNRQLSPPPEVLPRRRTMERRDLHTHYNSDLREYFQSCPLRNELNKGSKKYV